MFILTLCIAIAIHKTLRFSIVIIVLVQNFSLVAIATATIHVCVHNEPLAVEATESNRFVKLK